MRVGGVNVVDSNMHTFRLVREVDENGISGTGVVAEGVEFSNGMCAMCWLDKLSSIAVYPNRKQLLAIHGHGGKTSIEWDAVDDKQLELPFRP